MQSGPKQLKAWAELRFPTARKAADYLKLDESTFTKLANGTRSAGLRMAFYIQRQTGIPAETWLSDRSGKLSRHGKRMRRKPLSDKAPTQEQVC